MNARERWIDVLRALVAATGVANAATGLWALIAPRGWYDTFPGFGHHWVAAVGPYDEHLARDAGSGLLAVGVLLVWAAVAPQAGLLRPALAASLAFSVPHFGYHVASSDHLGTGDNIVNLTALALVVVVPAALLWLTSMGGDHLRTPSAREAVRTDSLIK